MKHYFVIFKSYQKPGLEHFEVDAFNKDEAKKTIMEQMGWRDYGGKHYESIFTRFYQGYVLPTKFGVDKRKAHLASLINSGQISKKEALEGVKKLMSDN